MNNFRPTSDLLIRLIVLGFLLQMPGQLMAQCDPDVTPPTLFCNQVTQVALGGTQPSAIDPHIFIEGTAFDFCDDDLDISFEFDGIPFIGDLLLNCDDQGTHYIQVTATDDAGNSTTCDAEVIIEDKLPPFATCVSDTTIYLPPSGSFLVDEYLILDTLVDNCPLDTLEFSFSDEFGNQVDSLWLTCSNLGTNFISVLVWDPVTTSTISCTTVVELIDSSSLCTSIELSGLVFQDSIDNCLFDSGESGVGPISLQITNLQDNVTDFISTDALGNYTFDSYFNAGLPNLAFEVTPILPGYTQTCGSPFIVNIPPGNTTATLDIPVQIIDDCPYLEVDIGAPFLRKCNENVLTVNYCNYSLLSIPDVYIEVTLDTVLNYISSSIPLSSNIDNVLTFDLGTVGPLACGSFTISVTDLCNSIVGQTLCTEAHIFPAEICDPMASPDWNGASVEIEKTCDGGVARFSIKNTGTGDIDEPLGYFIVEDVVMYMSENFELEAGESFDIEVPANGSTWRIEAQQAPGHPGLYQPVAWLEGCGGINTTGLVNVFPVNNTDPFLSIYCDEVIAPLDPNDKRGFPYGQGDDHLILANQDIEYMIRFQNIGTDTAFQVVILDTLSSDLNFASIRPGASSHPYIFEIDGNGIVQFTFPDIMLPDSTTNEPASNGFVKFRIEQQHDLTIGTVINNQAAIYFDFEAPVFTNQTWHTIGDPFVISGIETPNTKHLSASVFPNPFEKQIQFKLSGASGFDGQLRLFDLQGRLRKQIPINAPQFILERGSLESGIYFYQIDLDETETMHGKVMIK